MDSDTVRELLESVRRGSIEVDEALSNLRDLPLAELEFAHVDHHRALRVGLPEVVLGTGKTVQQITEVLREIDRCGQPALATRISPEVGQAVLRELPEARYDEISRTLLLRREPPRDRGRGPVAVVSAGTSDMPVAEEAAVTAEVFGNRVDRIYDVGVAGIHRLLHHKDRLDAATVLIVVAGMEGALASVVGGLLGKPIIAVPTSVGYGTSFGGLAALLTMLNSCAAGVTVVNIDNGYGAACAATLINRLPDGRPEDRKDR